MTAKLSITLSPDTLSPDIMNLDNPLETGRPVSGGEVIEQALQLLQRQEEHSDCWNMIGARVQRAANDPRPNLTSKRVREYLDRLRSKH